MKKLSDDYGITASEYLRKSAGLGRRLGLERISELSELLGNPQNSCRIIHVAGTNGKGSFCAMLSEILKKSGYRTGVFSSPALLDVKDSFMIDGESISAEKFDKLICSIIPVCESMADKPTEFEILTAAAYKYFSESGCDIAVVECGMGGDTDSTNITDSPLLSVITNIAFDHMGFLGNTLKEIASHKAGIIKKNRPVLYGGNSAEALEVISAAAEKNGSPLFVTDHSAFRHIKSDVKSTVIGFNSKEYTSALAGNCQLYNTANVLTAVEILRNEGLEIPEDAVVSGLLSAKLHGRFEVVSENPLVIFDGSHNPDGILQASESIKSFFSGKVVLLIGVMADKDYRIYPEMLGKHTETAFAVKPDNPRALDSKALADTFTEYGISAFPCSTVESGVKSAVEYAKEKNLPLIALGSLYLYREFSEALQKILS